jgi:magnesium chelatase subunit I
MNIPKINTLGELKKAGYHKKSVKEEIRANLIRKLKNKETTFPGILGYDDSVIPDTERALLSRHNILFLGLRGHPFFGMARGVVVGLVF